MRDFRFAVRILRKSPVFTATAMVTLAVCIGANTAIYSVVDRVLLRPLPYPEPERLAQVMVHFERHGSDEAGQTGSIWEALRDGIQSADVAVAAGVGQGVNLVANGEPQYVRQQRVSAGFFRVLGVAPALGREFTADEDRAGGPPAIVLSHGLWTRLGADPAIVGGSVIVRGESHRVVGVMPKAFTSLSPTDLWTPLQPSRSGEGGGQNYGVLARLHPGVGWPQADAEFAAIGQAAVDEVYRAQQNPARLHLISLQRGATQEMRRPVLVLWGAVGAVLLIGCVNIAGLLLARGATRAPEIATRMALGGGRAAIVRQLLAESLVVAACGGVLGLVVGYAGLQSFAALLEDAFGAPVVLSLDGRVLAVSSAIAAATSIVFGLIPAIQSSAVDLRDVLGASGSLSIAGAARAWPRRVLVASEIAVGVVLLAGAGLLARSLLFLLNQRAGFDATHVMTATLSLQDARYRSADAVNQLFGRTLEQMRAMPGVQHAAAALTLPYERALNMAFRLEPGAPSRMINLTYVTPDYFETLRIPTLRGRTFTDADAAGAAAVAIVNESFVHRYSPDRDPLGRVLLTGPSAATIVGIVGDVQVKASFGSFGPVAAIPAAYVPAAQTTAATFDLVHAWFSPSFFVRTSVDPRVVPADMQRAIRAVDPLLPFAKFRTLDEVRGEAVAMPRAHAILAGALAGVALLLSAVGLYSLVASSVAVRTRELGIRMALGASRTRALRSAVAPGAGLAVVGVIIGIAAARGAAVTLRGMIWGVTIDDPATVFIAAAIMILVSVSASLVPAVRIVRLNPIAAIRPRG